MQKLIKKYLTNRNLTYAIVLVLIVAAALYFGGGRYPVAVVNGKTISVREFREAYAFSIASGEGIWRVSQATSTPEVDVHSPEARAIVLDFLVENSLVHAAFEKEVGSDGQPLLERKVAQYMADPNVISAAQQVLGLSPATLRTQVIVPQAERDLLSARLFLKGQKLEDWLSDARAQAKVNVFSSELKWNGSQVVTGK